MNYFPTRPSNGSPCPPTLQVRRSSSSHPQRSAAPRRAAHEPYLAAGGGHAAVSDAPLSDLCSRAATSPSTQPKHVHGVHIARVSFAAPACARQPATAAEHPQTHHPPRPPAAPPRRHHAQERLRRAVGQQSCEA
eukprot:363429-Chlamydomonas_euryale.AAC.20